MMENDVQRLTARLAVAVMTGDGVVDVPELEALAHLDYLGFGRISNLVREEMQRALREPIDLEETCARFHAALPHSGPAVLAALAAISASNLAVPMKELWALRTISRLLAVPDDVADQAFSPALEIVEAAEHRARSSKVAPTTHRERLEQLVEAYRRVIERFDPEKVRVLGPEFVALAVRQLSRASAEFEARMDASEPGSGLDER